jgi:hypothetical protein
MATTAITVRRQFRQTLRQAMISSFPMLYYLPTPLLGASTVARNCCCLSVLKPGGKRLGVDERKRA